MFGGAGAVERLVTNIVAVEFCKKGDMRFISHLDLLRLFQRAMRRAHIPIFLTQGFNPHPKMSFRRAIKLGVESDAEEALFYVTGDMAPAEFMQKLNAELPEGIRIKNAKTHTH